MRNWRSRRGGGMIYEEPGAERREVRRMVGRRIRGCEGKVPWARIGGGVAIAILILLLARFGFGPILVGGMHEEDREECAANLKQIGLALQVYANAHDDDFPPGETMAEVFRELEGLTDGTGQPMVTEETFVCPAATEDQNEWNRTGEITSESSSYGWTPGLYATAPPDIMVAYDKSPDYHGGGRNVLFVDGHVEWKTEEGFQRALAEQEERLGMMRADPNAWKK